MNDVLVTEDPRNATFRAAAVDATLEAASASAGAEMDDDDNVKMDDAGVKMEDVSVKMEDASDNTIDVGDEAKDIENSTLDAVGDAKTDVDEPAAKGDRMDETA